MVGGNNIMGKTMPWFTNKSRANVNVCDENHKDTCTKHRNLCNQTCGNAKDEHL